MASPAGSPKGVGGGYVGLAGQFMGFPLIITDPKVLWDFSRDAGKIWKGKTNRQSPAQPKPSGSAGGGEKQWHVDFTQNWDNRWHFLGFWDIFSHWSHWSNEQLVSTCFEVQDLDSPNFSRVFHSTISFLAGKKFFQHSQGSSTPRPSPEAEKRPSKQPSFWGTLIWYGNLAVCHEELQCYHVE